MRHHRVAGRASDRLTLVGRRWRSFNDAGASPGCCAGSGRMLGRMLGQKLGQMRRQTVARARRAWPDSEGADRSDATELTAGSSASSSPSLQAGSAVATAELSAEGSKAASSPTLDPLDSAERENSFSVSMLPESSGDPSRPCLAPSGLFYCRGNTLIGCREVPAEGRVGVGDLPPACPPPSCQRSRRGTP